MSNKKRKDKEIRNQYLRVTGSQLVQEGKHYPMSTSRIGVTSLKRENEICPIGGEYKLVLQKPGGIHFIIVLPWPKVM